MNDRVFESQYVGSIYSETIELPTSTTYQGFITNLTLQDKETNYYYSYRNPVTGQIQNELILRVLQQVVFSNGEPVERESIGTASIVQIVPVYDPDTEAKPEINPGAEPGSRPDSDSDRRSAPFPGGIPGPSPGSSPGSKPGDSPDPSPGPSPGGTPGPSPGSAPGPSPGGSPSSKPGTAPNAPSTPGGSPGGSPGSKPRPNTPPGNNPGGAPGSAPAPGSGFSPGSLLPLGFPMLAPPGSGSAPKSGNTPGTATQTQPQTPSSPGSSTPPSPNLTCRYDGLNISGGVTAANAKLDNMNLVLNTIQTVQLAGIDTKIGTVNSKLGDALPNGGISGFLKRLWDRSNLSKVLELLTFITVLHNAYMLSNALTQTLFSAFDNILDIFKIDLKNSEGQEISTSQWVGKQVEGFFKTVFGAENVDGIKATWKRYNRIYQAAANIINSIQSISYSILEALEVVGNYVAKIGNAARKAGTVLENAYGWMNPNLNFMNGRFFRWLNGAQEVVDAVEEVSSEALSIVETTNELQKQTKELNNALNIGEAGVERKETQSKQAGTSPVIPVNQERKPDPTN